MSQSAGYTPNKYLCGVIIAGPTENISMSKPDSVIKKVIMS